MVEEARKGAGRADIADAAEKIAGGAEQIAEGAENYTEGAENYAEGAKNYAELVLTGARAVGAFHCSGCGYGVTVQRTLPQCPMCAGTAWEPAAWSPFQRSGETPLRV